MLQAITTSFTPVEQRLGDRRDPLPQLLPGPAAVGEHRRVAEVEVVLLWQRDQALVVTGQPTHPELYMATGSARVDSKEWLVGHDENVTTTMRPAAAPTWAIFD